MAGQMDSSISRTGRNSVGRARAQVIQWLEQGRLHPDSLVPSERVLAGELGLGRGTLRRALKLVEAEGRLVREGRRLLPASAQPAPHRPWVSKSIAVLLPKLSPDDQRWSRYVTLGVTDAVRSAGFHALTLNADLLTEADLAPLIAARPSGVLLPEPFHAEQSIHAIAGAFARVSIPVVVYGDSHEMAGFDRVFSDHEQGSYALTRWLLQQNRRPLRLWSRPWSSWWLKQRAAGYERAMREAGQPWIDPEPMPSLDLFATTREQFDFNVRQLVGFLCDRFKGPGQPDAVMVTSDREAFYVAGALKVLGLKPGQDVLIAGYDNSWSLCEERLLSEHRPAVTIDKHNEHMGREMLDLLMEQTPCANPAAPRIRRIVPELCVLETS